MMPIKTKEFASLLVAAVAAIVVAAAMWLLEAVCGGRPSAWLAPCLSV